MIQFLALLLLASLVAPVQAQTLCRADALGGVACAGERAQGWSPFATGEGLDAVQARPAARQDGREVLVPAQRRDAFGNTRLDRGVLARTGPRPRCRQDALGHLRCG